MKEKVLNTYDGKEYIFSTYFIINNSRLFSTNNFNFEDNLKNCFYIKKFGSNIHPKIYLDIKENNKWISKNKFIGDYNSLMNFIYENQNAFICIRGFSRASIGQFIRILNETKGISIRPVKFKNKLVEAQYERHILKKEQRIESLKEKLETSDEIENTEQYMKISNSVFGENRHKSRQKIIQLKNNLFRR